MDIKKSSLLRSFFFVLLLFFAGITGIVSASSEEQLHSLPQMSDDDFPQWERGYVPGNGDPVVEVINEGIVGGTNDGMLNASFSLYNAEDAGDFNGDFYLSPADYSVKVSKGGTRTIVAEAGEYYYNSTMDFYYSPGTGLSESGSGSTSSPIWLDDDCIYRAVFSYGEISDISTESTGVATSSTPGFIGLTAIIALITTFALFERKWK